MFDLPWAREELPVSVNDKATCELTILLPCLDEARTVGFCVEKACAFLTRNKIEGEVLVADNGSSDGSRSIAAAAGARVIEVAERGYGRALAAGIAAARGRYVIMGDADDSYDFLALDLFVDKLREGYDLVVGNRFAGGIRPGAMPALHRYLGNPVLSWVGRLFFDAPLGDFHCGLRGFARDAVLRLCLVMPGMEFASEMIVKAGLRGLRIAEVPTVLYPDRRGRAPHLRTWRDGWRHLRFLLLFSPRWLFFYPGLAMLLLGLAGMIGLLPGPWRVAGISLDVNTLVYAAAAVVCGFQALAFSILSRVFAVSSGLLPESDSLNRLTRAFSLEFGIVAGIVLVLAGVGASLFATGVWAGGAFGPLDPIRSLRVVIPAATAITLGMQLIFSSFFLQLLLNK